MSKLNSFLIISFLFLSFSLQAEEEIKSEVLATDKEEDLSSMDWSKPAVSRGFGNLADASKKDDLLSKQYNAGQVAYFFGDFKKAADSWLPLIEKNYTEALASMAWLYQAGKGVERNEKKAYRLYVKAAESGNAVAQNNLGVMYEQGKVVAIDLTKARNWYKKSAEQGYRFGQFNYANFLLDGMGGSKNRDQAISWYEKAAMQDVAQAKKKLAVIAPGRFAEDVH